MTDEIIDAVFKEAMAFIASIQDDTLGRGQVVKKTNFKSAELATYGMPLLLLGMIDGEETSQYIGGNTHADWRFDFNSYHYAPDMYMDNQAPEGTVSYPASLLLIIDKIRRHFSLGIWLTADMPAIEDKYQFCFTLSGLHRADALEADGLTMGWKIIFDSISLDEDTGFTETSTETLAHATQTNPDSLHP